MSSIGLAGFSLFGQEYLRHADESILEFVYSSQLITVFAITTGLVSLSYYFKFQSVLRDKQDKDYILRETLRKVEVTVPSSNQIFTIDLDDPKSVSITIQEINKAVTKANT